MSGASSTHVLKGKCKQKFCMRNCNKDMVIHRRVMQKWNFMK